MEALSLCLASLSGAACSRYVNSAVPKPLVAVHSFSSPAAVITRVAEGIRLGRESLCTVVPLAPGEDSLPRSNKDRSLSNTSFETSRPSTTSAGGRSDPGAEAAAAPPPPPVAPSPLLGKAADLGILRAQWIEKHQTSVYGTIVLIEDLDAFPTKDRLTIETTIVSHVDRVRQSCRGRSTRVVLVLLTSQAPGEVPKYGQYQSWEELAGQMRSKSGLSDSKVCLVAHDSCQADWLRSLDRLSRMAYDNAIAYHRDEAVRLKKKLKSDKVVRSASSKALTVRIRFKVGWHFEAGREFKLADHNYARGYDDVSRMPPSLEVIIAADVLMYRMMNISAAMKGGQIAAKLIETHMLWSEKLDLNIAHLTTVDAEHPTATRVVPRAVISVTRLLHLLHLAEALKRYSSLLLKVQPFAAEDPSAPIDPSKKLTDAGHWGGAHAGVPQLCYATAIAYRRARHLATALAQFGTTVNGPSLAMPMFVGRPPQRADEAVDLIRALVGTITAQDLSSHVFSSVSIAMPVCQDAGMIRQCAQLSYLIAEHYALDGKSGQAISHASAALKPDRVSAWPSISRAIHQVRKSALELANEPDPLRETELRQSITISASVNGSIFGVCPDVGAETVQHAPRSLNVAVTNISSTALSLRSIDVHFSFSSTSSLVTAAPCSVATVDTNVELAPNQTWTSRAPLPKEFGSRSGWFALTHAVTTLQNGSVFTSSFRSAPFAARLMQLAAKDAAYPNVPRLSRRVLPEPLEVSCVRFWAAPQVASVEIFSAPHAIEAERHIWVLNITATRGPVENGVLKFAVPSLAHVEPVVGFAGEGWGPWSLVTDNGLVAECPVPRLALGESCAIPCVVLCHKAGQVSLPMRFHYRSASTNFAQTGVFALHVLHPVFAHFAVHGAVRIKSLDCGGSLRMGVPCKAVCPADSAVSRFTESTEHADDRSTANEQKTHLRHSFAGVDESSAIRTTEAAEYKVVQHVVSDGRCAPLRLPVGKPFSLSIQLVNGLQCPINIEDLRIERHADSGVSVLGAPPFSPCTLQVNEQCSWLALMCGNLPIAEVNLGTLIVTLKRKDHSYLNLPSSSPPKLHALVESLGACEVKFELPLPCGSFSPSPVETQADFPTVVEVGKAFSVTLSLKNTHPTRSQNIDVAVEDVASSSVAVAGKTKCTVTLPGGTTRSLSWMAVARSPGHVAFPAVVLESNNHNMEAFEAISIRHEIVLHAQTRN